MTVNARVVKRRNGQESGGRPGRGAVWYGAGGGVGTRTHGRLVIAGLVAALCWALVPVPAAHAVSDCYYGGTNFSDGAVACQSGFQFRCSNGTWEALELTCNEPPPAPTRSRPAECACTANDEFNCSAVGEICCVSLEGDNCIKRCCQRP